MALAITIVIALVVIVALSICIYKLHSESEWRKEQIYMLGARYQDTADRLHQEIRHLHEERPKKGDLLTLE